MATDLVNDEHFEFQLQEMLNANSPEAEIVFNGVAYKKGTSQITESQQLRLAVALAEKRQKGNCARYARSTGSDRQVVPQFV